MDRTLNIDYIRRRHRDADFLNKKGDERKNRIKQNTGEIFVQELTFMDIKFENISDRRDFIDSFYYALMMEKVVRGEIYCNN